MLIHPWDAPRDDTEWQRWLAEHDFGRLAVNGLPGEPPHVQPPHFVYDAGRGEVVTHLACPNPLWPALEAGPDVLLSVVDDYVFVPGPGRPPGRPARARHPDELLRGPFTMPVRVARPGTAPRRVAEKP
ncbi:hypothetical protein HDC93_005480 [Streptomyces sp. AK010]|nr:hypothetical protein [Streptomyces sp. AK010]